jgi:hypothetical protein
MDVNVVDNILGACEQEGLINMGIILNGGGAVLFLILLNALLKTPKAHANFNKSSFYH